MTTSGLREELKHLIVDSLQLEDVDPATITDSMPLFGAGLNLDSIDALELATTIARTYDVKLGDDQATRDAFRSVHHLAEFIAARRGRTD